MLFSHIACAFSFIISSAAGQDILRLVWTSSNSQRKSTGVFSAPAHQEKGKVIVNRIASLRYPHFLAALASNDITQDITAVDIGRGNIVTFMSNNGTVARHHGGVSRKVSGIAVDWSNGNIYWADGEKQWIIAATWNLQRMRPIITGISDPRSVAVHPQQGYLFWSQVNIAQAMPGEIMRSTLSGTEKQNIHSSSSVPTSLAVDYSDSRLYWIDTNDGSIWSCDVQATSSPEKIYADKRSSFTGLAVHKGLIFLADNAQNKIVTISKDSGNIQNHLKVDSPLDLVVTGDDQQAEFAGPCDIKNGECEEFCFSQPPGNTRKCGCSIGLVLAPNGTSCISDLIREDFFVAIDADLHLIFQISSDGLRYNRLKLPGVKVPVQVEFDFETKMVYWTDVGTKSVNSAKWDGSDFRILAQENVEKPTGLALDRMSENLYWTDEDTGTINVIRVDGSHRKTILSDNIKSPRALAVDSFTGMMWWSDWSTKTIERASMDGSDRKVIVNEEVNWPNGIAVDHREKKIYWVDAQSDAIYSSNLDGSNKNVFKRFTENVHLFGIAVDIEYVYWTDWNQPSVMQIPKNYPNKYGMPFGPKIFTKLCDIHGFVDTRDITDLEKLSHPCRVNNGNCTGLCIPVPSEENAEAGHQTVERFSVSRVCRCGTEHDGDCDEPQEGEADTTPPTFNGTCPGDMIFSAPPCEKTVLVDYTIPTAVDDSGRVAVTKTPKLPPPVYLGYGKYKHVYEVTDAAGNEDSCQFVITVNVVRCAPVDSYIKSFDHVEAVAATCGNIYGSKVNVTCPDGMEILVNDHITCDIDGQWQGMPTCRKLHDKDSGAAGNEVPEHHVIMNSSGAKPTPPYVDGHGGSSDHGQRRSEMELIYLVIPAAVVVLIVIAAAAGYYYCKNRSMPLLETMEKHLTFYNLREVDRDRETLALGGNDASQRGRSRSVTTSVIEEPTMYTHVEQNIMNRAAASLPTIYSTPRRQSLPANAEVIYSEPAAEFNRENDRGFRRQGPTRGSYGSMR